MEKLAQARPDKRAAADILQLPAEDPSISIDAFAARKGCHKHTIRANPEYMEASHVTDDGRRMWRESFVVEACSGATDADYNRATAAKLIGCSETTLWRFAKRERGGYDKNEIFRALIKRGTMGEHAVLHFLGDANTAQLYFLMRETGSASAAFPEALPKLDSDGGLLWDAKLALGWLFRFIVDKEKKLRGQLDEFLEAASNDMYADEYEDYKTKIGEFVLPRELRETEEAISAARDKAKMLTAARKHDKTIRLALQKINYEIRIGKYKLANPDMDRLIARRDELWERRVDCDNENAVWDWYFQATAGIERI